MKDGYKRGFISFIFLFVLTNIGSAQSTNYYKDIEPIIQEHCISCHQKGEIGSIPFTSYQEVSSYASMIAYVTNIGYMPPWQVKLPKNAFHGERRLSQKKIDLIQQWVKQGLEEGEQVSKVLPEKARNILSDPDVVYSMSEGFEQYGVYYDQYRVFCIPTQLTEDKEISSIAFVPGNRNIVRACHVSIDTTNKYSPLDNWDPQYGYFSFGALGFAPMEGNWYNWQANQPPTIFKEGHGKYLPKGSNILLHIHYGPTGVPQKDSSYLQIKFAVKKLENHIITAPLIHRYNMTNDTFVIAANKTLRVHAKFVVPFDIVLEGVLPHSHLLGKTWEIFAVDPITNNSEVLLKIENWDFKWKQMYNFKEAKILKKGTVIHTLASYDNTTNNLSNPSIPPAEMTWGKRMYEEMFMVYFKYYEFQKLKRKADFELHLNQVNFTETDFEFKIHVSKKVILNARINSFDDSISKNLFSKRKFKKGIHSLDVSLSDLPKGNYYLELKEEKTGVEMHRMIIYVEDILFE